MSIQKQFITKEMRKDYEKYLKGTMRLDEIAKKYNLKSGQSATLSSVIMTEKLNKNKPK